MTPTAPHFPRLFLVRHGDTQWTDTRRHTGLTDIPLTEEGESRARQIGARLRNESFAHVFSSPLIRARRTCELAGFDRCVQIDADLVEWDYGHFEGLTSEEIRKMRPEWDLFRNSAPGGESPEDVAARADRFLGMVRAIGKDVVAFSSGHLIRMLAARWLGLPPATAGAFYTSTASVGVLGFEHGLAERVILLWNEVPLPATGER